MNGKRNVWIWIRVPLNAIERAIASLKESVMHKHGAASRQDSSRLRREADLDEEAAENLKKAVRDAEGAPPAHVPRDDTQ